MFKNSELQNQLLSLYVTPVAICCALLSVAFLWLNYEKSQQNHENILDLLQSIFFVETSDTTGADREIDARARSLVHNSSIQNIIIFKDQKKVRVFGPELQVPPENLLNLAQAYGCKHRHCRYRFKIHLAESEYLIIASQLNANPVINRYQLVFWLLLVSSVSLPLILYRAQKFKKYLTSYIEIIRSQLSSILQGEYQALCVKSPSGLHNMLIAEIDSLAKEFQEVKRNGADSSLDELKETLETVEIQNIELDMARKNALRTSRVKSEFFANICHVIRTPLNGIIGFSELLRKTPMSRHQLEYLETIDDSAKGLLTVVNDILDFSRLEIGKLSLEYKPTRIRQVIEDAIKLHAPAAEEKHLRLLTIIDHDFPENLLGDPLRLKQVLNNLISNAIKFTNKGHILISVSKDSENHSQLVLKFSVTDSGVGLSEEQKESLFEPFIETISNEQRNIEGAGLGLAIAKGIVDRMQGRIGVESESDKGATFWFTATLGQNPKSKADHGYLAGTLSQVNAVVCEKDPLSRNEITHYLRGWGAKVIEQTECKKVLATVRDLRPHTAVHLAVFGVDSRDDSFNVNKLPILIAQLNKEFSMIVLLIVNACNRGHIEPLLESSNNKLLTRPVHCNQLHQALSKQLGNLVGNSQTDNTPQDAATSFLAASAEKAAASKIRVLAVDDNPANLRLVIELVRELSAEAVGVRNGLEVLEELKKAHFDLILMDVQMPTMDGIEVTKRIRMQEVPPQRTPIIALTAHTVSEQKSKLLAAGMDDYLTKPVNENELQYVIQRWAKQGVKSNTAVPDPAPCQPPNSPQAPAHSDTAPPLVDLPLSLSLAKNKADLAKEMLEMMFNDLEAARDQLVPLAEHEAFAELQEIAHKLHGGSCYCGIEKLKQLTKTFDHKLENIVNKQAPAKCVTEDMQKLTHLVDQLIAWRRATNLTDFFGLNRNDSEQL